MSQRNDIELTIRKISMASQIVSSRGVKGGEDYRIYAGANLDTAYKIARVNTVLKTNLVPPKYKPLLQIYLIYLDQMRKAEFSSVGSTEITKLGFILGDPRKSIDAKKKFREEDLEE